MPIRAEVLSQLAEALAEIYFNPETAQSIALTLGLKVGHIPVAARPVDYWTHILHAAEKVRATQRLLDYATSQYPRLEPLAQACEAYAAAANSRTGFDIARAWFEPETELVPAGPFVMGSPIGTTFPPYEAPQHEVFLPVYRIGTYPVTVRQYATFIQRTGRLARPQLGWNGQKPPTDILDHPVSGITWYDAMDYCQWLSSETKRHYTLPNEAQWEKAARGIDGRLYPWGNEWEPASVYMGTGHAAVGLPQSAPAGVSLVPTRPAGCSPYGCYDMVGYVRQWTHSLWGMQAKQPDYVYPWIDDERNDITHFDVMRRIYRGGAAQDDVAHQRCAARHGAAPDIPDKLIGLRVVMQPRSVSEVPDDDFES